MNQNRIRILILMLLLVPRCHHLCLYHFRALNLRPLIVVSEQSYKSQNKLMIFYL